MVRTVCAGALVFAAVAGYSTAQGGTDPNSQPASACPEATATYEAAGIHFDTYGSECPGSDQVQADIADAKERAAEAQAIEDGTYKPLHEPIPASACPEATRRLNEAGMGPVDGYAEYCPDDKTVDSWISETDPLAPKGGR
jgi:hypothetical protein